MKRYLEDRIFDDLHRKMVVLAGPRQVGKTYLARQVAARFSRPCYLNYDSLADAAVINRQSWPADTDLLILDEIHKMAGWKSFLKGVYDTRPAACSLLVTGSARMDTFRQRASCGRWYGYVCGDGAAGRFLVPGFGQLISLQPTRCVPDAGRRYTFTAKRYTSTYTGKRTLNV